MASVDTTGGPGVPPSSNSDAFSSDFYVSNTMKTVLYCHLTGDNETAQMTPWTVADFARAQLGVEDFTFMLKEELPHCGRGNANVTIVASDIRSPAIQPGKAQFRDIGFLESGYLKIGKHFFSTDEYCISKIADELVEIRYCLPECRDGRPCIPKCTFPGQTLSFWPKRATLSSGNVEYKPTFYRPNGLAYAEDQINIRPHFVNMKPKVDIVCDQVMLPYSKVMARRITDRQLMKTAMEIQSMIFRFQVDGRLMFEDKDDHNCLRFRELPWGRYCVDGIQNVGEIAPFNNTEDEGVIFACSLPQLNNDQSLTLVFGIVLLSSSLLLLLILIVYALLWQQQNIHGWTAMGHTASMFFAYIFLGLVHIVGVKGGHLVKTTFCYVNGVLAHFFFLSIFFWLTVRSFELWLTFRSISPAQSNQGSRMIKYLLVGWGIPCVIVMVSITLDLAIGNSCTAFRLAKYGQISCYILPSSQGAYIYYPVAVTLLVSMTLFVITLYKLYLYKKQTSGVNRKDQSNRQLLIIFAKLFVVSGVTWIFEFISWLDMGTQVNWFWATVDIINALQPLALFVIYVCNRDILNSLEKKYPKFRECKASFSKLTSRSSSS